MSQEPRFTNKELQAITDMFSEKINAIRAKIIQLESEEQSLREGLRKIRQLGLDLQGHTVSSSNGTLGDIKRVFDNAGGWVKTGDIRKRYQLLTGKELPGTTLRGYLREYEHKLFERRGERRFTEWRMLKSDSD